MGYRPTALLPARSVHTDTAQHTHGILINTFAMSTTPTQHLFLGGVSFRLTVSDSSPSLQSHTLLTNLPG